MKNHKLVDGKTLQTNKRFCDLKGSQQEKIALWLKSEYSTACAENLRLLNTTEKTKILDAVYEKIVAAEIWIPYTEVQKHFSQKLVGWNRKVQR